MILRRLAGITLPLLLSLGAAAAAQDAAKTDSVKTDSAKPPPPVTLTLLTKDTVVAADGSYVETAHIEERAGNAAAAPAISQASIPYDTEMQDLAIVEAHTLKADGSIIAVEPSAIYEKLAAGQDGQEVTSLRSKVIVFPQVTGGDSIVYTARITTRKPSFPGQFSYGNLFSRTLPLIEARETVTVPKAMVLQVDNHEVEFSKKADGDNVVYSWHFSQPDALVEAPVTYTPMAHEPHFFASSFKDYAEMGRAYAAMTQSERVVTPKVSALADQLTQGVSDRKAQAQKLYEWVSGHIRYVAIELGQGSLIPHDVDSTLANGYGDCKDHDVLLQSLLQAKGIASQSILINGTNSYEMPAVASLASLNHVITYIPEFKLYMDSTARVAPFGVLPLNEYGKPMVTVSPGAAALGTMPLLPPGLSKVSFKSSAAVDKDGVVTGTSTTTASGPYSVGLRQAGLGIQAAGPQAVPKILTSQGLKDPEGSFTEDAPETLAPDYTISGTFKFGGWDKEVAGTMRFYMPAALRIAELPGGAAMGPADPGRLKDDEPTLCFSVDQTDDMSLKAPPGFAFGQTPKDLRVETPNLLFTAHYTLDGDTMSVHRQFTSKIDQLYCTGDVRARTVAALKQIKDSYDSNLWFTKASAAGTAVAMADPAKPDPAQDLFNTGLASFSAGQFDDAVKSFSQYLALKPDAFGAWYNRGLAYIRLNQLAPAAADFDKAAALKPDYFEAYVNAGSAYQRLTQYDRAVAAYAQAIKLKPDDPVAQRGMAFGHRALLQYDQAIEDFTKLIALKPDDPVAHYDRGLTHAVALQWDAAIADYGDALKLKPDYAEALEGEGTAYLALRQFPRAIEVYGQAITLSPQESRYYYNRGIVYDDAMQFTQAAADFDKAVALKPDYIQGWYSDGYAHEHQAQYPEAIADFSKAIALKPDDAAYLNERGVTYRLVKQYDAALADFGKAIALKADFALPWYNRGAVYLAQKLPDKAVSEFDQAIKLDAKYYYSYEERGFAQEQVGHFADAISDENQALKLKPDDVNALLHRADAYFRSGQPSMAVSDCDSAIALKPDFAGAYLLRGLAKQKLGQQTDANLDTGKATTLDPSIGK